MNILRVRITGRVQGVGYRAWTARTAESLALTGWVRNLADGSVEALFCGGETALRQMLEQCYAGPPRAKVDTIEQHGGMTDETHTAFVTRPDA